MKHTDVLMGIKEESFYEEAERRSFENRRILDNLTTKLRAIQSLSQNEGWKFFVEELKVEKLKLLGLLEKAQDPTSLAKIAGSLLAVESFVDWPAYVGAELDAAAKDLTKS